MAWGDADLLDGINYLFDYQKWTLRNGEKNPKADQITNHILNLKHDRDDPERYPDWYDNAVNFFVRRLRTAFRKLSPNQRPDLVVIVPSSKSLKICQGLEEVVKKVFDPYEIPVDCGCLQRTEDVEKKANGGNRAKEVHYRTIVARPESIPKGCRVLLVDDVSTTGNSLNACSEILEKGGAGDVIMLALAKTVYEDE